MASSTTLRCPICDSPHYVIAAYDFGIDRETGYHDQGVLAICAKCGFRALAEDWECADEEESQ